MVEIPQSCEHAVEIQQPRADGESLWLHPVKPFFAIEIFKRVLEHCQSLTDLQ
jgi:hypothetical protein